VVSLATLLPATRSLPIGSTASGALAVALLPTVGPEGLYQLPLLGRQLAANRQQKTGIGFFELGLACATLSIWARILASLG